MKSPSPRPEPVFPTEAATHNLPHPQHAERARCQRPYYTTAMTTLRNALLARRRPLVQRPDALGLIVRAAPARAGCERHLRHGDTRVPPANDPIRRPASAADPHPPWSGQRDIAAVADQLSRARFLQRPKVNVIVSAIFRSQADAQPGHGRGDQRRVAARHLSHDGRAVPRPPRDDRWRPAWPRRMDLLLPGTVYGERIDQVDMRFAKVLRFGKKRAKLQ